MERLDREARCVFCGRAIAPDEPSVGRGPVAAHSACADRSLGDERSWDRVAAALGDGAPADDPVAAAGDPAAEGVAVRQGDPVGADGTGRNGSDTAAAPGASTSGGRPGSAAARTGCMTIVLVALVPLVALVVWSAVDHALGSRNSG